MRKPPKLEFSYMSLKLRSHWTNVHYCYTVVTKMSQTSWLDSLHFMSISTVAFLLLLILICANFFPSGNIFFSSNTHTYVFSANPPLKNFHLRYKQVISLNLTTQLPLYLSFVINTVLPLCIVPNYLCKH